VARGAPNGVDGALATDEAGATAAGSVGNANERLHAVDAACVAGTSPATAGARGVME
jgi:hypothetical protein